MASLEVVLVVTAGGVGCYWHPLGIEAGDVAQGPPVHRTALQPRVIWPRASVVLRWRKVILDFP